MSRRIAYESRLELAIRARNPLAKRRVLRPYAMIERDRNWALSSRTDIVDVNSQSFARQIMYTNAGDKTARNSQAWQGGGGGPSGGTGGPGGGGGGGGGGWPF